MRLQLTPAAQPFTGSLACHWGVLGLVSGTLGTIALSLSELAETRLLRSVPVYSASAIARRLFHVSYGTTSNRIGFAMRYTYGPLLGLGLALARKHVAMSTASTAVFSSVAVATGELSVLPLIGAVPAWRRWPRRQKWLFGLHVLAWGIATAIAYDSLKPAE